MCWKNGNLTCPDDCTDSSQGNCDKTTGKCYCINGYTGKLPNLLLQIDFDFMDWTKYVL